MSVKTAKVKGRRAVRYESYHDLLNDAERLAAGQTRQLGNWSLGQVLEHLARAMDMSVEGSKLRAPWIVRFAVRLFVRKRWIQGPMPAGFRLPRAAAEQLVAGPTDADIAIARLKEAVARLQTETERMPHPALGELSLDEWDSLHLRHAEMHMSFILPADIGTRQTTPGRHEARSLRR